MKNKSKRWQPGVALALLFSCAGLTIASADPESNIYSPDQIHHYSCNGGAPTVTVTIGHHYRFQDGTYVWIPTYDAEAPLPKGKWDGAVWVSRTDAAPAHWREQQ